MSVLLAYDGMEHTKKALDYAIVYSKAFQEPLYIMTSVISKDALDMKNEIEHIRSYLDSAVEEANRGGVKAETIIEPGKPSEAVIAAAERYEASAIIVGRSDKTMFDRVVLGSVSEYVVRNAKCTVIVVQ